jgi:hypothetical protein
MEGLYELFGMDEEGSAQERARALAAALRGRGAMAQLAASSQNDLIRGAAPGLHQEVSTGREALTQAGHQRAGQSLQRALAAEAARRAEANASRERAFHLQDQGAQRAFQAEQNALSRASQEKAAALAAGQRAEAKAQGPNIPASEVANYGGIDAAVTMLDGLMKIRDDKAGGALAGLAQYMPGTDAAQYSDAQRAAAQTVGLILEGGKLAEGDLSRYMAMLPSAGDSAERARAKVEGIKRMLATKKAAQFSALKAAGYNTGSLTPEVAPVKSGAPSQAGGNVDLAAPVKPAADARQVVKKQVNRATKQTRLTYADGTTEVVDGIQ